MKLLFYFLRMAVSLFLSPAPILRNLVVYHVSPLWEHGGEYLGWVEGGGRGGL